MKPRKLFRGCLLVEVAWTNFCILFSSECGVSQLSSEESVAHVSLPDIKKPQSSMTHHLDLVRSGVASIETELQQRASLPAVDNSNLRYKAINY